MGQALPWVAVGLSALSLAYAGLRGHAKGGGLPPGGGAILGAAVLVPLLGALLALPTGAPWSPGGALFPGVLLGAAGALGGALLGNPARYGDAPGGESLAAGARMAAAAALFGVAAGLYEPFRHGYLSLLAGCCLGGAAAGLLLTGGFALIARDEGPSASAVGAAQATFALLAVGAAAYLAAHHRNPAGGREWLPLVPLFAATLAAGATLRGALAAGLGAGAALVAIPALAMAWLIGHRLGGTPGFLHAVAISLAGYGVIAWLGESDGEEPRAGIRADVGLLGALIVLGVGALVFRELHGLGLALAAVCGVGLMGLVPRQAVLPGAVGMGLLLALYRVYTEANDTARGFQPDFLYYYLALALGGLLPILLAGLVTLGRLRGVAPGPAALRVGLAGLAALALPLAVWVLVGERPQAALVVGLGVGGAFLLSRAAEGGVERVSLASLLAAAAAWSAVQFTHLLSPLGELKREHRVGILAAAGAVILIGILLAAALDRRPDAAPETA